MLPPQFLGQLLSSKDGLFSGSFSGGEGAALLQFSDKHSPSCGRAPISMEKAKALQHALPRCPEKSASRVSLQSMLTFRVPLESPLHHISSGALLMEEIV